jgi:hypothetical protein
MTKQEEFITKTLLPYFTGEEEFSIGPAGGCVYNGPNGAHCAFAKCVKRPDNLEEEGSASKMLREKGFSILTDEALGMGFATEEWNVIQGIHDRKGGDLRHFDHLSKHGPFNELRAAIAAYHESKK